MPCELATDVVQGHQRGKERSLRVFEAVSTGCPPDFVSRFLHSIRRPGGAYFLWVLEGFHKHAIV